MNLARLTRGLALRVPAGTRAWPAFANLGAAIPVGL